MICHISIPFGAARMRSSNKGRQDQVQMQTPSTLQHPPALRAKGFSIKGPKAFRPE